MSTRHGPVLLGGALLLVVVLAGCGPATPTPAQPTVGAPPPLPALQSPLPSPTPTSGPPYPTIASPIRLPLCTPPPPPPPEALQPSEAPALEDYVFGEPQVILTDTTPIDIIGWMPDGRNLLLARTLPDRPRRVIEALDTQTGRTVRYAETDPYASDVAFPLDRGRGVAFYDLGEQQPGDIVPPNDLMASHGPGQVQPLVQRVSSRTMAVDPHTASLVRFEPAPGSPPPLPPQAQADLRVLSLPVDPYLWKYPKYFPDRVETGYTGDEFRTVVRPDGSLVAFISDPYLFIYDTATQTACEVDLGIAENGEYRSAWLAKWSPDGRYLAMRTTAAFPGSTWSFADLTIYDTLTGDLKHVEIVPERFFSDFVWAPDSRNLVVYGRTAMNSEGSPRQGLYFVDAASGEHRLALADPRLASPGAASALKWSPEGDQLLVFCLTRPQDPKADVEFWHLCIIDVSVGDAP